ncbi:CBS domain-containing protein [Prochlorococcus sp. AH-716-E17]|nr:CBS domain-containing protein [Prochlorococcus sp. AH-716-E17]
MSKISNYLLPLNSTILEAANIINSSKNRACVVVEDNNHVIGILSEGDILRAILNDANLKSSIKPFINTNFYFLTSGEEFNEKIKNFFLIKQVTLIPIISKDMKLKDIITLNDYLKSLD